MIKSEYFAFKVIKVFLLFDLIEVQVLTTENTESCLLNCVGNECNFDDCEE